MQHKRQAPTRGARIHRLFPIAGISAAIVAVLAHVAGGAAIAHLGLGAILAYVGVDVASLGGGVLVAGLAAIVTIKVLLVITARQWWQRR